MNFQIPRLSPAMHQMPMAFFPSAPEDVAPENFDPMLTKAIPGLNMVDYRTFTTHPKLENSREFPDPVEEEADEEIAADEVFKLGEEFEDADPLGLGGGANAPGGRGGMGAAGGGSGGDDMMSGGLGGGMGGLGGGMGGPPGGMGGPPGGMGGPSGGIGGDGLGGGFGTTGGPADDVVQTRKGSDVTDYWRALQRKPTTDFKLVRFFDVHQKSGETYEYRVRVWLSDPNNEDPAGTFDQLRGSSGTAAMGNQGDEGEEEDYSEEEEEEEEEGGGMFDPAGGNGNEDDEDEGPVYVKIPITSQMKAADVRKRLGRMQIEPDKKDDSIEYVSLAEPTSEKEEDGSTKYRVVEVPRHLFRDGTSSKTDLYLKYARCSEWSAPIKVKVEASRSTVVAGELQPGKVVKMKDASGEDMIFNASEPVSEIVASIWSNDLGTRIPAKRKVYRGDSLDFFAPSHVVHPITSQVYLYKTDNKAITGMAKYMTPVQTKKVLVDAMGGDEIPLPRAEKMRHHLPTEMLVLNEFGEFEVRNDIDDQTTFRILSLKPDDSKYVGKDRRQKKDKTMNGRGMGGPGGNMGF